MFFHRAYYIAGTFRNHWNEVTPFSTIIYFVNKDFILTDKKWRESIVYELNDVETEIDTDKVIVNCVERLGWITSIRLYNENRKSMERASS